MITAPSVLPTPIGRHVHAGVGGELGHGRRVGSARVLAVGQQQDRRRREVARPAAATRWSGSGSATGVAGDRAQRDEHALPERRAAAGLEPVDRGEHLGVVVGRLLGDQRAVAEGDDADVDRRRLRLDEPSRRVLGDREAGRLDVVGAHAVGHVDDEQHRAARLASWPAWPAGGTGRRSSRPARRSAGRTGRAGGDPSRRDPGGHDQPGRRQRVDPASAPALQRARRPRRARGTSTRAASRDGQANVIAAAVASHRADHLDQRGGEVVVGGDVVEPHARRGGSSACSACSRASTSAWKRRRNSGSLVSATTCSPVSASSTTISPTSGSSRSSGSTSAHGDHLVALRETGQRPLPAGRR